MFFILIESLNCRWGTKKNKNPRGEHISTRDNGLFKGGPEKQQENVCFTKTYLLKFIVHRAILLELLSTVYA